MAWLERPSAIRRGPPARVGEVVEGHPRPAPPDELGDDLGVDHRSAARDATDRVGEVIEILDPILEQVPDAARAVRDDAQRERRLDVLRQTRIPPRSRARRGWPRRPSGLRRCAWAAYGCRRWRHRGGARAPHQQARGVPGLAPTSKPPRRAAERSLRAAAASRRPGRWSVMPPDQGPDRRARELVLRDEPEGPAVWRPGDLGRWRRETRSARRTAADRRPQAPAPPRTPRCPAARYRAARNPVGASGRPPGRGPVLGLADHVETVGLEQRSRLEAEAGVVVDDEHAVHAAILTPHVRRSYRVTPDPASQSVCQSRPMSGRSIRVAIGVLGTVVAVAGESIAINAGTPPVPVSSISRSG